MSHANPDQHVPAGSAPPLGAGAAASYDKSGQLLEYARRYGCRSLVETGLYYGAGSGMPVLALGAVERYVAIDYQEDNIQRARAAFAGDARVSLVTGDSAEMLHTILTETFAWIGSLPEPVLFWLDAHAISGEEASPTTCPLMAELDAIIAWAGHSVVLIDDVWGMGRIPGWPTLPEVLKACGDAGLWGDVHDDGATVFCLP